ncbi:MAG: exonuclease SbcD [Maritimibacter sp.]|nr:exonuclease SbcD [Maritimibacter sp.]
MRFIHSSDLHLGRRFANIPELPDTNTRGRLMEARHGAIGRLAAAARDSGASHILLAGDTFDTATPSTQVIRRALAAMGDDPDLQWWLLPGNHDNLRDAEPLWQEIARAAPANVHALTQAAPVQLAPDVTLLPAPVTFRNPGTDLSAALVDMPSPEGSVRLGLAHGGVTDFTDSGAHIPPDRDRSAGLGYLALGDWHGRMAVGDRTHYSGTPEQDRFKHGRRGVCLSVSLPVSQSGTPELAEAEIAEVETGAFLWSEAELPLHSGQDAAAALADLLPDSGRSDMLLRVRASGWAGLPEQAALKSAAADAAPDFAVFELVTTALGTTYETADLDEIDRGGALRLAADRLRADAESDTLSQDDRDIAAAALSRLYAYVKDTA